MPLDTSPKISLALARLWRVLYTLLLLRSHWDGLVYQMLTEQDGAGLVDSLAALIKGSGLL